MPRLVVPEHLGPGQFAARTLKDFPSDGYRDRLVKYIPTESVALYALTDKLLIAHYGINASGVATGAPEDSVLRVASWGLFLLGLVGTPVYLYRQRLPKQPWKMHATISAVAFCFWVYTLGGSLILLYHWYNVVLAAILAPVFTYVAGWFEPKS